MTDNFKKQLQQRNANYEAYRQAQRDPVANSISSRSIQPDAHPKKDFFQEQKQAQEAQLKKYNLEQQIQQQLLEQQRIQQDYLDQQRLYEEQFQQQKHFEEQERLNQQFIEQQAQNKNSE